MVTTPLSLLTATATHNYIVEHNIAKKEIDPIKILQFMKKHVSPYDFCGGPMRSSPFMILGMLSRSDYLANRFDNATIYFNGICADVDFIDPAFYSKKKASNKGNFMVAQFSQLTRAALDDVEKPYKGIMDKFKTSYPNKAHTMVEVDPEIDRIIIQSDVKFEEKRHHILHYMGGHRIKYT
jgi:hypothetical protein